MKIEVGPRDPGEDCGGPSRLGGDFGGPKDPSEDCGEQRDLVEEYVGQREPGQ